MSDNLLSPKTEAPNGVPPKNIIAFLALGILIAIGAYSIWSGDAKSQTAEEKKAKATLQEATSTKDAGVKGDPKDVAAFADKAGVPATFRAPASATAANPFAAASQPSSGANQSAAAGPPGNNPPLPPFPMTVTGPAKTGAANSPASIDAVRDTEISNAKPVVFDVSTAAGQGATDKPTNPIEQLLEQEKLAQAERMRSVAKAGDLSQVAGLLGAQNQKTPAAGRAADTSWLKEYSSTRRDAGIRPSLPEAPLMLNQGSVIEAVTLREINSDLPGVVTARTTRDIYDSTSQRSLILPKGTLAIGEYSSEVRMGQQRLLFAFTRLVLPNGQSFDLSGFNGSDATGRSGIEGNVDNHYFRLFGTSLLIGLLADKVVSPRAVPQGTNGQAGGLSATGQILTDTAKAILERNREVAPTISVPSGVRVVIEVKRDMIFPSAYRG